MSLGFELLMERGLSTPIHRRLKSPRVPFDAGTPNWGNSSTIIPIPNSLVLHSVKSLVSNSLVHITTPNIPDVKQIFSKTCIKVSLQHVSDVAEHPAVGIFSRVHCYPQCKKKGHS
jgi:hypothetical protein